jgi:hypothetical protein
MFIPKGTICLPNLWHCHHDPSAYGDNAASFDPGRFLDSSGKIILGLAETHGEGHSTYGFGRRVCVGNLVANDTLFISIATTLWAANLERVRDRYGKEVPLDTDAFFDSGAVLYVFNVQRSSSSLLWCGGKCIDWYLLRSRPVDYECNFTPRFPEALSILAAQEELFRA